MPHYVLLVNFTDEGLRRVTDMPSRAQPIQQTLLQLGIRVHSQFFTLGQYDLVMVVEAPNQEAVLKLSLSQALQGYARAETLPAFTFSEFNRVINELQ
jgi:uncharacterized protein with GYD domain